jgi:hypothetical protein
MNNRKDINIMSAFKALVLSFILCVCAVSVNAEPPRQFNPQRFEMRLEQYITVQAALSPAEASKFFPLYREMRRKQFAYFDNRAFHNINSNDEGAAAEAIRKRDNNDLQMKKIQQQYHNKFLKILPASKVYRIIKAEDDFHRHMFKRAAQKR